MKKLLSAFSILLVFMLTVLAGCQIEPGHTHTWEDTYSSSETTHWFKCQECEEIKNQKPHNFPKTWSLEEDSTETEERFCKVCNFRQTKEHKHVWNHTEYQYDSTSETDTRTCTECAYIDAKEHLHTNESETVLKEATCSEKGLKSYKCSVCEKSRTEEAATLSHTEDSGTITAQPTCTENGVKTYKCTVCEAIVRTEEIPATGHTEDEGIITKQVTCTEKGVKTYKCIRCQKVLRGEKILPEGHIEDSGTITTAATTDSVGVITYKCSNCNEVMGEGLYCGPFGEDGNAPSSSSTYVYFGVFPRTVKASTVTIDKTHSITMGANTYYKGSDENWYTSCAENGSGSTYSDGSKVNKKDSNSYRWFMVEPIKWKVLTTDYNGTGKALLLAEEILTADVPYYKYKSDSNRRTVGSDTNIYPNNYKYSQIRAYLNGLDYYYDQSSSETIKKTDYTDKGFLQTAFIESAQTLIAITTVVNDGDSTTDETGKLSKADGTTLRYSWSSSYYPDYTCANTEDKIFLLSQKEVTTTAYGFGTYDTTGTESGRARKSTDYAKANNGGGGYWWLRSPKYNSSDMAYCIAISSDNARWTYEGDRGVVPALSISLQ